ncbi:MAG: undecaprenyl-diphosphate phosphatase [Fusicatenibacter sp.]|nr:undecaprenyl-diphosphate phosphatase [Fusicatenibacter sp.]
MNIVEWLKVLLLGIVEGITEWLPISSTGHMILVDELVTLHVSNDFKNVFEVVIQLGAILAVVVIYFWDLWPFHTKVKAKQKSYFANPSDVKALLAIQNFVDHYCYLDKIIMWFKILVSCLPAAVIGLAFNDWIEEHLMNYVIVALMLIIYGVLFILIENYNKKRTPTITKMKEISWKTALYIGIFQLLSIVPGTSRSGATIIGGILLGASRELAAEYTFFLAIPVMFGASLLKLLKHGLAFTGTEVAIMIVGMAVAFLVSILAIKFLMQYIRKHDFKVFGWYRIVLGVIVLVYFGVKTVIA